MAGTRTVALTNAGINTGTIPKTILQIAASANIALFATKVHVSFDGTVANAAKVLVEVVRSATGGTGTSLTSADAPRNVNASESETPQYTAKQEFTAEPTGGKVIARRWVHPQADYTFNLPCKVKAGETLGVRCTTTSAVNCHASIECEE